MKKVVIYSFCFIVSGCGGGGGGHSDAPAKNVSPGGIWKGTVTYTDTGETGQIIGIVTESGELRFVSNDSVQSVGNITTSGANYSGTITEYAPIGQTFGENNLAVISGSISGQISERHQISGKSEYQGKTLSTFTLDYDVAYDTDSSLAAIQGTYSNATATLTVNAGQITGQDSDGCTYNGAASVINSSYNAYRITFTAANCGQFNGDYSGLGTVTTENNVTSLTFQANSSQYIVTNSLDR